MRRLLKFRAGYGSQVLIYDAAIMRDFFTFDYSESALALGCAVTEGAIAFFLMAEDGLADFTLWEGRPKSTAEFDRFVEGQVSLESGELCVHEPEDPALILSVPPGEYNVVLAQKKIDVENFLKIDIFLDLRWSGATNPGGSSRAARSERA